MKWSELDCRWLYIFLILRVFDCVAKNTQKRKKNLLSMRRTSPLAVHRKGVGCRGGCPSCLLSDIQQCSWFCSLCRKLTLLLSPVVYACVGVCVKSEIHLALSNDGPMDSSSLLIWIVSVKKSIRILCSLLQYFIKVILPLLFLMFG